jgi:hypothetical protein
MIAVAVWLTLGLAACGSSGTKTVTVTNPSTTSIQDTTGSAGSSGGAGISTGDTSTSSSAVAGHGFFIAIQGYRIF